MYTEYTEVGWISSIRREYRDLLKASAFFSVTVFIVYNLSTRPISRHLYSGIFYDHLDTKYTKPSKID